MDIVYSFDEFLACVDASFKFMKDVDDTVRYGQAFFNVLWELRPDIANKVRATEFDTFHEHSVSPEVIMHIENMWELRPDEANGMV